MPEIILPGLLLLGLMLFGVLGGWSLWLILPLIAAAAGVTVIIWLFRRNRLK